MPNFVHLLKIHWKISDIKLY